MSPRRISNDLVREAPTVRQDNTVEHAVRAILDSGLPALPVVDDRGRLRGIFGEREFLAALFPGYVVQLSHAGFVRRSLDDVIDKRASARTDPVADYLTTDHVDVTEDFSDLQLAEIFLHHRVLIIPVLDSDRQPIGVITRTDFFTRLVQRFLSAR